MRKIALAATAALIPLIPVAPAFATGIASSSITSPTTGTHYLVTDAAPAIPVTVSGSTSGGTAGDLVDIRCYTRPGEWDTIDAGIGVPIDGSGNFTVQIPSDALFGPCVLRAVPHDYPATSSITAFSGPKVATEYLTSTRVLSGPHAGLVYDYNVVLASQHAFDYFYGATSGSFGGARLQYADGTSSRNLWKASAKLGLDLSGTRSPLLVDGRNAYGPYPAAKIYPGSTTAPGLPGLTFSASRSATTGVITIRETDPFVVCPDETYPPTSSSCPQFTSAGIRLERTIIVDDGGLQVHISDLWRSTDGKAHTLSAHYIEGVEGLDFSSGTTTATNVGLKLPWLGSSYQTFSSPTSYAAPAKVPASLFVRDDVAADDGNAYYPRGAMTFDLAPSKVDRLSYNTLDFRTENLAVPAGGTRLLRRDYVTGTTESAVSAKAAASRERMNPYRADGSIKIAGSPRYLGNNVYNTTGTHQTATARRHRGATVTYDLKVQNDGTTADGFKLRGAGGSAAFRVRYFAGTKDVTRAVTAGTYRLTNLAPGATRVIRLVITVRSAARIGTLRSWLLSAASVHDSTRRDAVRARLRVSSR